MTRFSPLDQTDAKVWVLYFEVVLVIPVINQHYLKCLYHFLFSSSWPPFLSFISIFIFRYLMNCIVILCVMMHIWELFINCIWKFGMGFFICAVVQNTFYFHTLLTDGVIFLTHEGKKLFWNYWKYSIILKEYEYYNKMDVKNHSQLKKEIIEISL